jgi:hypothetical protein
MARRFDRLAYPFMSGVSGQYGIKASEGLQIQQFQEAGGVTEDFAAPLPQPSRFGAQAKSGQFREAYNYFNDLQNSTTDSAGKFYEGMDPALPKYRNLAGTYGVNDLAAPRDRMDAPAALSIVPTSTSNIARPRTVAAGYDETRQVLTVVFRDGTYYNYYQVTPQEWDRFKASSSKGPLLNQPSAKNPGGGFLLYKPRGEASVGFMTQAAQEVQYRIARTAQRVYLTETEAKQYSRPGRAGRPRKANSSAAGKNPSRGGRP